MLNGEGIARLRSEVVPRLSFREKSYDHNQCVVRELLSL